MDEYAIKIIKHLSEKEYDFSAYNPSMNDKDAKEFLEEIKQELK